MYSKKLTVVCLSLSGRFSVDWEKWNMEAAGHGDAELLYQNSGGQHMMTVSARPAVSQKQNKPQNKYTNIKPLYDLCVTFFFQNESK
jgi:hypothetical protein